MSKGIFHFHHILQPSPMCPELCLFLEFGIFCASTLGSLPFLQVCLNMDFPSMMVCFPLCSVYLFFCYDISSCIIELGMYILLSRYYNSEFLSELYNVEQF